MDEHLKEMLEESLNEWSDIDKHKAAREKKDKKIISLYCSKNKEADVVGIIELLLKYSGMPLHDKETVETFKESYPDKLNTKLLFEFLDVKDLYQEYLESGECDDD